jgi:hypothetical protein
MMNNQTSLPAARCDISTKKSSVLLIDNFKVGIAASWRKVASSIIETGQLLLDAEQQLDRAGFAALRKHLVENGIMSESVISKLLGIARNSVLSAPENVPQLPASYATLYVLAGKNPDDVQSAIAEGKISPFTQLKDVNDLFPDAPAKSTRQVVATNGFSVVVRSDLSGVPAELISNFKSAVAAIGAYVPVEVKGI